MAAAKSKKTVANKSTAKSATQEKSSQPVEDPNPVGDPRRMVVVEITPNGSFSVQPVGIEAYSVPTLLRLVANDVEQQLGV